MNLTKSQQDEIQRKRAEIIKKVEGDSISLAAQKLLDDNKKRIEKQKSNKLSKRNMELYINIENPTAENDSELPEIKKRVIKLDSKIPEDEDFGL